MVRDCGLTGNAFLVRRSVPQIGVARSLGVTGGEAVVRHAGMSRPTEVRTPGSGEISCSLSPVVGGRVIRHR